MKFVCALVASVALLTACGGNDSTDASSSPQLETKSPSDESAKEASPRNDGGYSSSIILDSPDGIEQITWEDLMPEGEELVLAQLYEEYFTELEQSMRQRETMLKDMSEEQRRRGS